MRGRRPVYDHLMAATVINNCTPRDAPRDHSRTLEKLQTFHSLLMSVVLRVWGNGEAYKRRTQMYRKPSGWLHARESQSSCASVGHGTPCTRMSILAAVASAPCPNTCGKQRASRCERRHGRPSSSIGATGRQLPPRALIGVHTHGYGAWDVRAAGRGAQLRGDAPLHLLFYHRRKRCIVPRGKPRSRPLPQLSLASPGLPQGGTLLAETTRSTGSTTLSKR
mmetsp:Transcript_1696/g.3439  ORF Transcript_1696/g.3439 Transcript_1696/m.3439 type:complete len:222 (-) Transcript_1696:253-918(-)